MKCNNCGVNNAPVKKCCSNCGAFLEGYTINNVTSETGYRNADGGFTPCVIDIRPIPDIRPEFITWDDSDTAMEGTDNALIGLDFGFGKDKQATNVVRIVPKASYSTEDIQRTNAAREKYENVTGRQFHLAKTVTDLIAKNIDWEIEDGQLILKFNSVYAPQFKTPDLNIWNIIHEGFESGIAIEMEILKKLEKK